MWYEVFIYAPNISETAGNIAIWESPYDDTPIAEIKQYDWYSGTGGLEIPHPGQQYNVIGQTMFVDVAISAMRKLRKKFHADRLRDFRIGVHAMELIGGQKVVQAIWNEDAREWDISEEQVRIERRKAEDLGVWLSEQYGWVPNVDGRGFGEVPVHYWIKSFSLDKEGYRSGTVGILFTEDYRMATELVQVYSSMKRDEGNYVGAEAQILYGLDLARYGWERGIQAEFNLDYSSWEGVSDEYSQQQFDIAEGIRREYAEEIEKRAIVEPYDKFGMPADIKSLISEELREQDITVDLGALRKVAGMNWPPMPLYLSGRRK